MFIEIDGKKVVNNLCPECATEYAASGAITPSMEIVRLHTDVFILICVHPGNCSILDLGQCPCGSIGFLENTSEQNGIAKYRNEYVFDLNIDTTSTEVGTYCPSCVPKTCECCGKTSYSTKTIKTDDGEKNLCRNCIGSYRVCAICGEVHTTNMHPRNARTAVCNTCAPTAIVCDHCGNLTTEANRVLFGDRYLCNNCTAQQECAHCGKQTSCVHISDFWICAEHYLECSSLPQIDGYGHTSGVTFYKGKTENPRAFFGIENEVQLKVTTKYKSSTLGFRKRLLAKFAKDIFPDIATKRDGSLTKSVGGDCVNNGVELVWQPMSYMYIHKNRDKFKKLFELISPMLETNMSSSGQHIHVNKDAFTAIVLHKFVDFFYNEKTQEFLFKVAGRGANSYAMIRKLDTTSASKAKKSPTRSFAQAVVIKSVKQNRHRNIGLDRYDIVNMTNSRTYEVRLFKGSRTYEEFMVKVEFTAALYSFAMNATLEYELDNFLSYIAANSKLYPELAKMAAEFTPNPDYIPKSDSTVNTDDDDFDDLEEEPLCSESTYNEGDEDAYPSEPCYDDDDDY